MKNFAAFMTVGILTMTAALPTHVRAAGISGNAAQVGLEQNILASTRHYSGQNVVPTMSALGVGVHALTRSTVATHATHRLRLNTKSFVPAPLDSSALELPESTFSPAIVIKSTAVTATDAALAPLHPSKGTAIVGAYEQLTAWNVDASTTVSFFYQGSYFATPDAAHAYWAEMTASNQIDCSANFGVPCTVFGFSDPASNSTVLYDIAQVNQCTLEVASIGSQTAISANSKAVATIAVNAFSAAIAQAQKVCTSSANPPPSPSPTATPAATDFTVSHVFVERSGAQDDSAPILHAKRKKLVIVAIDLHVNSAPSGAAVSVNLTATRSGKRILSKAINSRLPAGSAGGDYRLAIKYKLPNKTGKIKFTGAATIDSQTQQASVSFMVKK